MTQSYSYNSNVWEKKGGGGFLALFGAPFLAVGLFAFFGTIDMEKGSPWYAQYILASIFTLVGSLLVFGRRRVTIDKGRRTITVAYSLVLPVKKTVHPLTDDAHVTITEEVRRTKDSSYIVYPVRLDIGGKAGGKAGGETVDIGEPRDNGESRRLAEEVAKFAGVDIVDSSGGETVTRRAGTFDETLREKLRKSGEETPLPDRPANMRTLVDEGAVGLTVHLPPRGVGPGVAFAAAPGLIFAAIVYFWFVGPILGPALGPTAEGGNSIPKLFIIFAVIFMALPVLAGVLPALSRALRSERMELDRDTLTVMSKGIFFTSQKEIPLTELEELKLGYKNRRGGGSMRVGSGNKSLKLPMGFGASRSVITARSDRETIEFGAALADEELAYIHAVMLKKMG